MEQRSLALTIATLLKGAQTMHHHAVQHGNATDDDWPEFYANYLCIRLRPILATMQAPDPTPVVVAHVRGVWNDGPGWFAQLAGLAD